MAARKYVSDYRIEDSVTPSGRVESRRVYQGTYYRFVESLECIRKLRIHIITVSIAAIVLLLPMLLTNSDLGRTIYIVLPVAASFVPLYLLLAGARRLGFPEVIFTREHREKTDCRISKASLWLSIFLGLSSLGGIVYCVRRSVTGEEIACVICLIVAWIGSLWLLPQRKKAKAIPVEAEKEDGAQ